MSRFSGRVERFPKPADSMRLVLQAAWEVVTGPKFRGNEIKSKNSAEGSLGASELAACGLIDQFSPQTDSLPKLLLPIARLAGKRAEIREIAL